MLEVRNLHSGYGDAHVIRGVSLDVAPGEVVAVLGRNGMGKTTLIRSIMGLAPPQIRAGSIRWRDESLIGLRPHDIAARKVAIVPQGRRLFPSLTVTEHLTMLKGARARTGWTVERVFALFPRLAERRNHRGGQLSGGERGMLAVGRALMIDPQMILMDEPSEGLAPVMVQHLEGILLDLSAGACRSCWSSKTSIARLRSPTASMFWKPVRSCIKAMPQPSRNRPNCCFNTSACSNEIFQIDRVKWPTAVVRWNRFPALRPLLCSAAAA